MGGMTTAATLGEGQFSVRVPKAAELVARHIRRQIVSGEIAEGDALPSENVLMGEFAISRPTLREAFRVLEAEGLITVRRGARGGARAQVPSTDVAARYAGLVLQHRHTTVADVLEARVIVEAPAARMVAERRNRVSLANQLQELLDSVDLESASRFHEFNRLLVELAGNETLRLLTAMLEHISDAAAMSYIAHRHAEDTRLAKRAYRTRQRLIELIRAGDGDGAEELWAVHLHEQGRVLSEGVGSEVLDLFG
jgi:GntR family transcriptional regulator, transcriptional repressor for pyruvate dehydrogenase complex